MVKESNVDKYLTPVSINIRTLLDSGELAFVIDAGEDDALRVYRNYRGMAKRRGFDVSVYVRDGKVYVVNNAMLAGASIEKGDSPTESEYWELTDYEVKLGDHGKAKNCRDVIAFTYSGRDHAVLDLGDEETCRRRFISYRNFITMHEKDYPIEIVKQGTKIFFNRKKSRKKKQG